MEITERLIRRIARQEFGQMAKGGAYTRGGGGGGSYTLPVAADGTLGGVQLGYTTSAANRYYAVQLDSSQRAYVNVPWTDHYAWSDITDKPNFAAVATSGSYNDLNNKPSIPSVSGSVSGSTLTITINGSSYSLTDTNTWRPIGTGATDAAAGNHLHDDRYLKLTGGTITGDLTVNQTFTCQSVEIGHTNEMNATGSSNLYLQYRNSGNLVLCYNGQNVGIGDANPAYKLEVAGNCRISSKLLVATTDSTYELNVGGTIYATGSITERSDIRCKDVETYQWSPTLDMIADAPIIRYTMKDDKTHRMRVGSVAQYWEKMMPEAVSKDNDGILSMAQGDICMVSVIALAREVRKLREEVKLLRNGRS